MRITGTHVYTWLKCPHAVTLDLHEDRALRRPLEDYEEMVLRRGRDFEAEFVAGFEVFEPRYEKGDFATGAHETVAAMQRGEEWIFQGVLLDERYAVPRLGLPDLMRRVPGASALGEHHYEVVDVKSSGRPRGDQILQVVFYSELLEGIQERLPESGGLILKDEREERFAILDYRAALGEVLAGVERAVADRQSTRPGFRSGCESCSWSSVCLPAMEAAEDATLLQGVTPGLRQVLEQVGVRRWTELVSGSGERLRRGRIENAQIQRLVRAAQARAEGRPALEPIPTMRSRPAALLHFLTDPFHERVLWMGSLFPATPSGRVVSRAPASQEDEWAAFQELVAEVPAGSPMLHYGRGVPSWHEEAAYQQEAGLGVERQFIDLARRLRGAAIYPGPVFGLADHVRFGLGLDPHRYGNSRAAPLWLESEDAEQRLCAKGEGDLRDLALLRGKLLGPRKVEAPAGASEAAES